MKVMSGFFRRSFLFLSFSNSSNSFIIYVCAFSKSAKANEIP